MATSWKRPNAVIVVRFYHRKLYWGKKNLKKEFRRAGKSLKEKDVQTIAMWRIKSSSVPSNKGESALKALIVRNRLKITVEHVEIRQATKLIIERYW